MTESKDERWIMDQPASHEIGVLLLSLSFLPALIVGAIAGRFGGMSLGVGAGALVVSIMSLAAAWITWQAGPPPDTAHPGDHRTLLMVFLLFGCIPLAMSLVMFASAWEDRPGYRHGPALRPAWLLRACTWGRVLANLTFLSGFIVTLWDTSLGSIGDGFPLIGAGALAHAMIGAVAGSKLSGVLTFVVVGVGFLGFGFFAQSVAPA